MYQSNVKFRLQRFKHVVDVQKKTNRIIGICKNIASYGSGVNKY